MASILFLLVIAQVPAQVSGTATDGNTAPRPTFTAATSRTAVYVGDVFEYRISVRYPANVSFATQELDKTLIVRPFELLGVRTEHKNFGDSQALDIRLTLASYERPGELTIPSLSLFYYSRKGPRALQDGSTVQKDIPAEELVIPAQSIHLYSTLVEKEAGLRDSVVFMRSPRGDFFLPVVAAMLLLLSLAWMAVTVGRKVLVRAQAGTDTAQKDIRQDVLRTLQDLECRSESDGSGRSTFLELSKLIRRYLEVAYGIKSLALTPEETREVLCEAAPEGEFPLQIESILERCDESFFNPSGDVRADAASLCREALNLLAAAPPVRK